MPLIAWLAPVLEKLKLAQASGALGALGGGVRDVLGAGVSGIQQIQQNPFQAAQSGLQKIPGFGTSTGVPFDVIQGLGDAGKGLDYLKAAPEKIQQLQQDIGLGGFGGGGQPMPQAPQLQTPPPTQQPEQPTAFPTMMNPAGAEEWVRQSQGVSQPFATARMVPFGAAPTPQADPGFMGNLKNVAGDLAGVPFDILHGIQDEIGDARGRFKEGSYYSAGLERQAAMREQLEAQRAELATSVGQTSQEQGSPRTRKALSAFGGLTGGILDEPATRFEPITKSDIAPEYQGEYANMGEIQKRLLAASSVEDVMPILLDDELYGLSEGQGRYDRQGNLVMERKRPPTEEKERAYGDAVTKLFADAQRDGSPYGKWNYETNRPEDPRMAKVFDRRLENLQTKGGGVNVSQTVNTGEGDVERSTRVEIEKMANARRQKSEQLQLVKNRYDKDKHLLNYWNKQLGKGVDMLDSTFPSLVKKEWAEARDRQATLINRTMAFFAAETKELYGATLTKNEREIAEEILLSVKDNPALFGTKLNDIILLSNLSNARLHMWEKQGANKTVKPYDITNTDLVKELEMEIATEKSRLELIPEYRNAEEQFVTRVAIDIVEDRWALTPGSIGAIFKEYEPLIRRMRSRESTRQ